MKTSPEQPDRSELIAQLRGQLIDRQRPERIIAANKIADYGDESWAQELLFLGLKDPSPEVIDVCTARLCSVKPSNKLLDDILLELDGSDRISGNCAEQIFRCWALRFPGLIRILALRGLKRRGLRVLVDVIARVDINRDRELAAAFTSIAPLIPAEVLKLQGKDYDGCVFSLELLSRMFPFIRSESKTLSLYIQALARGPIFWLGDDRLTAVLAHLRELSEIHPLSHQLISRTARQALKQGNGGYIKKIVPILTHRSTYAAKNAMLLAEIVSAGGAEGEEMKAAVGLAGTRIRLYGSVLIDPYRQVLANVPDDETAGKILSALALIGIRSRVALPEITAILRHSPSELVQLMAIDALIAIGFSSPSEAISALTLCTLSGPENVQNAAVEALKKWHKAPIVPVPAQTVQPSKSKMPNFKLSLAQTCLSFFGLRPQGC